MPATEAAVMYAQPVAISALRRLSFIPKPSPEVDEAKYSLTMAAIMEEVMLIFRAVKTEGRQLGSLSLKKTSRLVET